ncbi:MAG: translocation/assembly module TamB domain-containing protein, partial [Thermoanaerobaculia bacterium]|nr:translocation/assembly module TamB domain-containing protein [Thermoanaerobaculia bacterium]
PVRPLLGADVLSAREGTVEGRLFGPPGTLRFDVRAAFNSLAYNTYRIADLLAEAQGEFTADRTLQSAEVNASFDYFSVPNVVVERSELRATYADSSVTFESDFQIDERRDARVAGAADLRLGQNQVQVDDFSFRFDDDQWQLLQTASITYSDAYRISNLLLYADSPDLTQQIALDGVVDFDGRQSLILTIEDFRINTVADLIGFDGLGGRVNGFIDLTGPAEAPQLSGTLDLDITSSGRDVGTLDLGLSYDSLRLDVDARLAHEAGGTLEAGGGLPIDLRLTTASAQTGQQGLEVATASIADDPVDLYLRTDRFDIGWVEPFLDPAVVNSVEGILEADLGVRGTFQTPELVGEAALSNGLVGMPILGTTYRGIEARVSTQGDQLVIDQARLRSGGGTLNATGRIGLTDLSVGEFDLQLDGERFLAIDNAEYRFVVDTDLALRGTTQEPILNGAADVVSGDIYLVSETVNADALVVELTEEDLQKLEERFGIRITEADTSTFSFYQALEMDIDVSIERDTWVRSRETPTMDIQFTGDLDVSKAPFADPRVFGVIEVVPERSRVEALGKIFGLETGTLTFNGDAFNPRLDITAEYTVPNDQVVIVLEIDDRPVDDLRVELRSENPPGLDQTQIVSYLLFGKPPGETFFLGGGGSGEGGGLFQQGSQLAIGQLAGFLEGLAGQQLGLDVIEIKTDAFTGETQLTAGRYFQVPGPCRTFYAAIDQTISTGATGGQGSNIENTNTQVTLECELQQWLLVRLRGPGSMEVNLRWRYAY